MQNEYLERKGSVGRQIFRRSEREAEVALGKKIWELNLREEAEAVETHVWAIVSYLNYWAITKSK